MHPTWCMAKRAQIDHWPHFQLTHVVLFMGYTTNEQEDTDRGRQSSEYETD